MKKVYLFICLFIINCSNYNKVKRPNIIVIMADDLGYGDIGAYGAKPKNVKTPNIDKLAKGGIKFTSGYSSASTCTPTRYSFLTGTYAFRKKNTGIAPPNAPAIIKPGTETIASVLKKAGYSTAVIGKWHLGLGGPNGPDWNGKLEPGPKEIGFDNGGEFKGEFSQLCKNMGLKESTSLPWNPQSNSILERIHQALAGCLRTFELESMDVDPEESGPFQRHLAMAAYATRPGYHATHGCSPGEMVFGRNMFMPVVPQTGMKGRSLP